MEYEETEKNPFLRRRIWKIRCVERRGRVDRRGEKIFYQYRWKIRCAGSDTAQKAAALDIQTICPLHGPVLKENLGFYIGKYLTWSSYEPEEDGVLVACASIHGNTKAAAEKMVEVLRANGASKVVFMDLTRDDMAEALQMLSARKDHSCSSFL